MTVTKLPQLNEDFINYCVNKILSETDPYGDQREMTSQEAHELKQDLKKLKNEWISTLTSMLDLYIEKYNEKRVEKFSIKQKSLYKRYAEAIVKTCQLQKAKTKD